MFQYLYSSLIAKLFSTSCAIVTGIVSLKLFDLYLSPYEFGIVAVALQILAYLPMLDGGVRTAANYRLLSSSSESEKLRLYAFCQKFYSWFGLIVLLGTALAMAAYWFTPQIRASGQPFAFFLALGLTLALTSLAAAQGGLLVALQSQHLCFWILGSCSLLNLGVLALSFHFGLKLWAFPLANGAALLCAWPIYIWAIRSKVPGFKVFDLAIGPEFKADLKALGRQAFDSFRTQLSIVLLFSLDLVIVGLVYPPQEAAVYALFTRVFAILRTFIQSAGEVSWPLWAQNQSGGKDWSYLLLKGNAWIYGSIAGALAFSLLPFLRWFMGPEWTGGQTLFAVMLLRFVVTGISNPAGYFLIGRGQFRSLAKALELEVVVAVVLAVALNSYGPVGIAFSFLIATTCGTFLPILFQYAAAAQHRPAFVLRSLWFRAAAAFAASVLVTGFLIQMFSRELAIFSGAMGTFTGLGIAFLFAYFHWRFSARHATASAFNLKAVVSKI